MMFKGNNLLKIEDLVKSNRLDVYTKENDKNKEQFSSCGLIKSCKWYKTKKNEQLKDIIVLTVTDGSDFEIEVHIDNIYVELIISSLESVDNIKNVSPKNFNGKKLLFEGDIVYFNNKNICIFKNGTIYKESA